MIFIEVEILVNIFTPITKSTVFKNLSPKISAYPLWLMQNVREQEVYPIDIRFYVWGNLGGGLEYFWG
jgi:hypothetical protein